MLTNKRSVIIPVSDDCRELFPTNETIVSCRTFAVKNGQKATEHSTIISLDFANFVSVDTSEFYGTEMPLDTSGIDGDGFALAESVERRS